MKKRTRNSLVYKMRMWAYRLTKEDINNFIWRAIDNIGLIFAAIVMFGILIILPAFFH